MTVEHTLNFLMLIHAVVRTVMHLSYIDAFLDTTDTNTDG